VPDGVDLAWQAKHFLGTPVPGATSATVSLAHVVAAAEFIDVALVETPSEADVPTAEDVVLELGRIASEPERTA
jgi:hypothetical protein